MTFRMVVMLAILTLPALGCKPAPRIVYQQVPVPVPVPCPEPPAMAWPTLPIANVTASTPPAEVAKAYALSIEILQAHLWQAMRLLDGYRVKTQAGAPALPPKRTP